MRKYENIPCLASSSGLLVWSPAAAEKTVKLLGMDCSNARMAMGLDAMENAVIPLVINQSAGQEFRVNLHTATIPDPNVY